MKIDIKHSTKKRGLVFKKDVFLVTFRVELTEEEKEIIKSTGIKDYILVEYNDPHGLELNVQVGSLLRRPDHTREFTSTNDAKLFEADLIEGLKGISNHVKENKGGLEDQSFEL